jgi:hypothetical protein
LGTNGFKAKIRRKERKMIVPNQSAFILYPLMISPFIFHCNIVIVILLRGFINASLDQCCLFIEEEKMVLGKGNVSFLIFTMIIDKKSAI